MQKPGGKQILVTMDGRESHMFISDGLAYLPVICPTNEDIESYPKVILFPSVDWKLSDIDDDGQWEDSDDYVGFNTNVYATNFTNIIMSSSRSCQIPNTKPLTSLL